MVVLKKALCLKLDVAGRNFWNFCLYLLPLCKKGKIFQACGRSVVGSETWAVKEEDKVGEK